MRCKDSGVLPLNWPTLARPDLRTTYFSLYRVVRHALMCPCRILRYFPRGHPVGLYVPAAQLPPIVRASRSAGQRRSFLLAVGTESDLGSETFPMSLFKQYTLIWIQCVRIRHQIRMPCMFLPRSLGVHEHRSDAHMPTSAIDTRVAPSFIEGMTWYFKTTPQPSSSRCFALYTLAYLLPRTCHVVARWPGSQIAPSNWQRNGTNVVATIDLVVKARWTPPVVIRGSMERYAEAVGARCSGAYPTCRYEGL